MDLELFRDSIKVHLKDKRYQHCIGVEEVAHDLAVIHGCDTTKACIAGLLHDCAKNLPDVELVKKCIEKHLPISEVEALSPYLLHAKVGAALAKEDYGVLDEDILNSIIYHTTGRPAMSLLEKIIFTADYIEPFRDPLPDIDIIRRMAYENLDLAVSMILKNTLDYLRSNGAVIDTLTIETYDYYKELTQSVLV